MAAMNMNQEQFKQLIREEKPVLVDFWAPWCSYCRRIGPAYEKIGEEYADSLAVGKINIDEEPRLAGAEGIEDIPTLCCTGTERPWIPSPRPAQRQKSTVSFRKPWRNNGGFRYEQQSCL
ncbi:thioredoxin family protein [Faecalibacterium prausnitzii]|uniref:thioredoxin family protein n=1 Tax=Faecalibacterium prausnitzii TaxID=853 RepID=UPI00269610E5